MGDLFMKQLKIENELMVNSNAFSYAKFKRNSIPNSLFVKLIKLLGCVALTVVLIEAIIVSLK